MQHPFQNGKKNKKNNEKAGRNDERKQRSVVGSAANWVHAANYSIQTWQVATKRD